MSELYIALDNMREEIKHYLLITPFTIYNKKWLSYNTILIAFDKKI